MLNLSKVSCGSPMCLTQLLSSSHIVVKTKLTVRHSNGMLGISYIQCNFIARAFVFVEFIFRTTDALTSTKQSKKLWTGFLAVSFSLQYFQSFNSRNHKTSSRMWSTGSVVFLLQ